MYLLSTALAVWYTFLQLILWFSYIFTVFFFTYFICKFILIYLLLVGVCTCACVEVRGQHQVSSSVAPSFFFYLELTMLPREPLVSAFSIQAHTSATSVSTQVVEVKQVVMPPQQGLCHVSSFPSPSTGQLFNIGVRIFNCKSGLISFSSVGFYLPYFDMHYVGDALLVMVSY